MSFHTPLEVRTMTSHLLSRGVSPSRAEEKDWILLEPLSYDVGHLGSGETITVPAGFVTDFASVPRIFWSIIAPGGLHAAAAVVHDYLYRSEEGRARYSRREADAIFLEAMLASGTPLLRARIMWLAVRGPGGAAAHRWTAGARYYRVR